MKTLEELHFELVEQESHENQIWALYQKDNGEKIYLNANGDVDFGWTPRTTLTQELKDAIEQKMKERGWWK